MRWNARFTTPLLTLSLTVLTPAQEPALWFGLSPGPHPVGFQSLWELDAGRTYVTAFDQGATYGGDGKAPRPILVNLWYPATAGGDGPMPYRDYFEIAPDDPAVEALANALVDHAEGVVTQELLGKEPAHLDEDEGRWWSAFLETPTASHRDADPAPGPFPLLVYHSGAGSSYEDNSTLCEYLASHGYVVVGSAYPKAHGRSLNIDGGDGSVRDMEFLVRFASRLDFVDWSRVAVAGHSAGAQAALRFAARPDCVADAVVLLDTTQDYYSLAIPTYRPLVDEVLEQTGAFTEPMLVMAGPGAMFALCDRLIHAERTYLTLPDLGHNEYIAQGLQRLLVRRWSATEDGSARQDQELVHQARTEAQYRVVCETLLAQLDAALRDRGESFERSRRGLQSAAFGSAPHAVVVPRGADAPPPFDQTGSQPPTPRQLRDLVQDADTEAVGRILREFHEKAPEAPVYDSSMLAGSLVFELMVDGRREDARTLHQCCKELGMDAAYVLGFLADMSRMAGRGDEERLYLEHALALEPDDPELTRRLQALQDDGR